MPGYWMPVMGGTMPPPQPVNAHGFHPSAMPYMPMDWAPPLAAHPGLNDPYSSMRAPPQYLPPGDKCNDMQPREALQHLPYHTRSSGPPNNPYPEWLRKEDENASEGTHESEGQGTLAKLGFEYSDPELQKQKTERKKAEYRAELEAQINAKRRERIDAKAAEMEADLKKEAEITEYRRTLATEDATFSPRVGSMNPDFQVDPRPPKGDMEVADSINFPSELRKPHRDSVIVKFRSDNAFMTSDELEKKQRVAKELQDALRQQIEEKKNREIAKKSALRDAERQEEARVQKELESITQRHEEQLRKEKEKESLKDSKADVVAEAWSKALQESRTSRHSFKMAPVVETPVDRTMGQPSNDNKKEDPVPATHRNAEDLVPICEDAVKRATEEQMERLRKEIESQKKETKHDMEKLASQLERQYQAEVISLREKALHLERENASAKAELQKLRLDMIRTNNDVREEVVKTAHSIKPPSISWEVLGNPAPGPLERELWGWGRNPGAVREMFINATQTETGGKRASQSDGGTRGATPMANSESVWLFPDGQVVPAGKMQEEAGIRKEHAVKFTPRTDIHLERTSTGQSRATDVENILKRNDSKLRALEGMRTHSGSLDPEALEAFLKKYVVGIPPQKDGQSARRMESMSLVSEPIQEEAAEQDLVGTKTLTDEEASLPSEKAARPEKDTLDAEMERISAPTGTFDLPNADEKEVDSTAQDMIDALDKEMQDLKTRTDVPATPSVDDSSVQRMESNMSLVTDTQWMPAL
ncbi:hypothetical protein BSKO_12692 [Bryopsis sp. KO-2023]|nr:hypothetical protein BSKO_12692 [Bryopsis sp. KO-2023]